jgi:hypothetical protein
LPPLPFILKIFFGCELGSIVLEYLDYTFLISNFNYYIKIDRLVINIL